MWLFVLFIAVPLIEIALFIQIGGILGLWTTLLVVILTALLGTWLVRSQGLRALSNLQRSFRDLRDPTEPLAHGAMILFSGALLLTPGFFTDAVGFLLLMPPVRDAVYAYAKGRVAARVSVSAQGFTDRTPDQSDVIDGDFEEVQPEDTRRNSTDQPSGWTKH